MRHLERFKTPGGDGSGRWARLIVCAAFYVIFLGLGGAILRFALDIARPERELFLPSMIVAAVLAWFYTHDRKESRIAEAGNLAGAMMAVRLWSDLMVVDASWLGYLAYFGAWYVWGSYLMTVLIVLAVGWRMEKERENEG